MLSNELAEETAISALHWILIRRACVRFARATIWDNPRDESLMISLLTEPLRAMRATNTVLKRVEALIAEVIMTAIPDPEARVIAMKRVVDLNE